MNRVVTSGLKEAKDGIEGYIAHPERAEKGPAILMIHQHSGLTGYLKTAAYKFAQLGYTAVVPNLYHMLGYPAETHIDKGTEIQNKTPDPDFVRVIDRGWRYCLSRSDVDGARVGVVGYCMGGRLGIHFVAGVRRVLSVGARRATDQDPAAPSLRCRARDPVSVDDSLRRP
jgi:dienelactone hydrolase